ncbi:class I SAM-dependent methyltransferase [Aquibacillus albus]|uniref:Ubiquinone/menaquinone biosynthesis C-methylase UbiE n=1 Tax=Aquibacillus albus TaxID=1168171 RepID=A0ABS2N3C1_9BACI|nr:class I SAM-dependent methyltransferase [Aquibacillus albus]MBM7572622.1 ubiquinone/menaquinone biosynthesis C-methylase UbiE [Aquibacillus albus]
MTLNYTNLLAKLGVGGAHPGSMAVTKKIAEKLPIDSFTKILDAGCGTGKTVEYLAEKFDCETVGLDIDTEMTNQAIQRIETKPIKATIVQGSTEQLPFESDSFDIILSESVTSFTNISKSLAEYARVLHPNGRLVLLEMTNTGWLDKSEIQELKDFYQVTDVPTKDEWIHLIEKNGFSLMEKETVDPYLGSNYELNHPAKMNETMLQLMAKHHYLSEKYADRLGSYLYYCQRKE